MNVESHSVRTAESRTPISLPTRKKLAMFYGGSHCVVKAGRGRVSPHHLNGVPSQSDFANLIPLSLDLHNGIKRERENPERLPLELHASELAKIANAHFEGGKPTRAYACMRLAYAMSAHFYRQEHRDFDKELQLAAHALYCLRRSTGWQREELAYSALKWLLEREIYPSINHRKVLPPFGRLCLLLELGSWLSEFDRSPEGLEILKQSNAKAKQFEHQLGPTGIARFQRQLSNSFVRRGQYGGEQERALKLSRECGDDSENNRWAIVTTELNLHLSKRDSKKSLNIVKDTLEYAEKETGFFYGDLNLGTTIQTTLGYIAQSILSEGQHARTKHQRNRIKERLAALKSQEGKYAVTTRLDDIPNLHWWLDESAKNVPEVGGLLIGRLFPVLSMDSLRVIRAVVNRLL